MKRRNFLKTSCAVLSLPAISASNGFASVAPNKLIRPNVLRPGEIVGLITPGTPVDEKRLANAEQRIKELGLRSKLGKNVAMSPSVVDSSIQARLDDLHTMFRDPEVRAVIAVRGGYGSVELLDRIDYDLKGECVGRRFQFVCLLPFASNAGLTIQFPQFGKRLSDLVL